VGLQRPYLRAEVGQRRPLAGQARPVWSISGRAFRREARPDRLDRDPPMVGTRRLWRKGGEPQPLDRSHPRRTGQRGSLSSRCGRRCNRRWPSERVHRTFRQPEPHGPSKSVSRKEPSRYAADATARATHTNELVQKRTPGFEPGLHYECPEESGSAPLVAATADGRSGIARRAATQKVTPSRAFALAPVLS
jgi:hypothetical protein